ncbi:hypothetical protein FVEN_g12815 [Fusarium venenatum]|uniref:Uncharacterized protein n=1 Tax=Fusarium venenatum TaxID=56646 RepID=A0A2L2TEG3_9HYPO|nr:uncharacterized protein FVRRES_08436 [Fusarium venenatum]KAG8356696.1 hypothetical protein FVEN_g12815 [Fusarium venenatum]CEI68359.1 unnamed protein product [Fusarium venenatum]
MGNCLCRASEEEELKQTVFPNHDKPMGFVHAAPHPTQESFVTVIMQDDEITPVEIVEPAVPTKAHA